MTGLGGHHALWARPTLTPVDRNKAYCSKGHFWKGAKFPGSVGHPMTKMLSASGGGLCPPDQGLYPWTSLGALPPDPRYRLVLRTCHGAPQPLTPSAAYACVFSYLQSYTPFPDL